MSRKTISLLRLMLMFFLAILTFTLSVTAATPSSFKTYALEEEVLHERVLKASKSSQITYTTFFNIGQVSSSALQTSASKLKQLGRKVFINFDTLVEDEVVARITVNPNLAKATAGDLNFVVDISREANAQVKNTFEKLFGKPVEVMRCEQDNFGMLVVIFGKLDVSEMDETNLLAYYYDSDANTYAKIKNAKCMVDSNGFVCLQSKVGGYIIITEGD